MKKSIFSLVLLFAANICFSQNGYNNRNPGGFGPNENQAGMMAFADDVFSGRATPARKGDVLYNIIDNNTGEVVTYKKITAFANGATMDANKMAGLDRKDDGVLIRKYGNEYFMLTKDLLSVKDFGARGDGVTDDYVNLQKAIDVCSFWGRALHVPAGVYAHSRGFNLPQTYVPDPTNQTGIGYNPWFTISITGDGSMSTFFKYTGKDSTASFSARGGAGNFGGGGLQNITIVGKANTVGLYVEGRGNLTTHGCVFSNHAVGVLLHNNHPGDFTEFVVMYDIVFKGCTTFLEYLVTGGGDKSFHGSGIEGGSGAAYSPNPIKIFGGVPYNAPMTMHFFAVNSDKYPTMSYFYNGGDANPNFYGHMTFENMYAGNHQPNGGIPTTFNTLQKEGYPITFVGTVSSYNSIAAGKMRCANVFVAGGQGTPYLTGPSARTNSLKYPAGAAQIAQSTTNANSITDGQLIFVTCICKGFLYRALLIMGDKGAGTTGVTKVITVLDNSTTIGFTAPNIAMDSNGNIFIAGRKTDGTNWDVDVTIQMNILPLSATIFSKGDNIYQAQ